MLRAYGGGKFFGEQYGPGPVQVVFLHGWARQGRDFAEAAQRLANEGIGSLTLDLPGFGSSPAPTVAGGARLYAHELLAPMEEITSEPVVLVGHSFGGKIATVFAANQPALVKALVLTGVPLVHSGVRSKPALRFRFVRFLHAKGLVGDQRMEEARQRHGSTDYRNSSGIMRDVLVAVVNESYEHELEAVHAPIYMVWGGAETVAPVADVSRATPHMRVPHSLRVVTGVGHFLPIEAPGELVAAIVEAIACSR